MPGCCWKKSCRRFTDELDELRSGPDEATEERDAAIQQLQREAMRERADRFRAGEYDARSERTC